METHDWEPFSDDLVICRKCGIVCDEAADPEEWDAECAPDEMLIQGGDNPWQ